METTNAESKQQQKSSDNSRVNKLNSESILGSQNNNKRQHKFCKKFREGKEET